MPHPYVIGQAVYLILQKYKFKSNSQLSQLPPFRKSWCIWYYKSTNLKAIHNFPIAHRQPKTGVFDITKVQI